jgi:hypothetical protein
VRGDHPVLADDALKRVKLALLVVTRSVRRDVDVAAVVVEDRPLVRLLQRRARRLVEVERLRDRVGSGLGSLLEVDPQQLRAAQPARPLGERLEMVDLVAIEQDGCADDPPPLAAFAGAFPQRATLKPARS